MIAARVILGLCVFAAAAAVAAPPSPDPAVVRIELSIRKDKFHSARGTAMIIAVVKNVGAVPYNTRPGQQDIQIFQMPATGTPSARKRCDFGTLSVNAEYRCEFDRPWDSSGPEGTRPPDFKAMILYDPDIRLDGNPKNDDLNSRNNQLQVPGTRINDLFRRP